MNLAIKTTAIMFVLILMACNENENRNAESFIQQYQIPAEIIDSSPRFNRINFSHELETPHSRKLFYIKWLRHKIKKIHYTNSAVNILIFLKISDYNKNKANFIMWKNGNKYPDAPSDGAFYDVEIGGYTRWIKSNMDETIVREMYPEIKCNVTKETYSKIVIDFNKEVESLDFFRSIEFIK